MNARQKAKKLKKENAYLKQQLNNHYTMYQFQHISTVPIDRYETEFCMSKYNYERANLNKEQLDESVRNRLANSFAELIKDNIIVESVDRGHLISFRSTLLIGFAGEKDNEYLQRYYDYC